MAAWIEQADQCDAEEDRAYKDRTGYEIPDDLKYKESRRARVKEARQALEKREQALNPGKTIEAKKQISFADQDARIRQGRTGISTTARRPLYKSRTWSPSFPAGPSSAPQGMTGPPRVRS